MQNIANIVFRVKQKTAVGYRIQTSTRELLFSTLNSNSFIIIIELILLAIW
jgi:hypothetical protein